MYTKKMQLFFVPTILILLFYFTNTQAQSHSHPAKTPAPAPKPPTSTGPTNVVSVLLKPGHFTTFARLIKETHVDTQLHSQLNASVDGVTIFAPTDAAFSNSTKLDVGALNPRDKVSFIQYHILPRVLSSNSEFETLSNPVRTLAGAKDKFPLDVTTTDNSVTIDTGVVKTSVSATVYRDKSVAIYQIDRVLVPKSMYTEPPPAPAPMKARAMSPVAPKDASCSNNHGFNFVVFCGGVIAAAAFMSL